MTSQNAAAIDLGTNSCRLLIVDGKGNTLYKNAISTRMGEGMSAHNRFTDEAIKRGVECFCSFKMLMDKYQAGKYRAVATAACRTAENGAEFVDLIRRQANIELEVIDGYEEARLNLQGAMLNVQKEKSKYAVVYDLGGGSTEITLSTREMKPEILHTVSIPWGARNSSEKFELVDFDEAKAAVLAEEIGSYAYKFAQEAKLKDYAGNVCFIATSSTPLRLAHIAKGWMPYRRDKADGMKVTVEEFDRAIALVRAMTAEERRQNSCIGPSRADIFNSACVIFSQIYRDLGAKELVASLKSAVDGIVMELQNGD